MLRAREKVSTGEQRERYGAVGPSGLLQRCPSSRAERTGRCASENARVPGSILGFDYPAGKIYLPD